MLLSCRKELGSQADNKALETELHSTHWRQEPEPVRPFDDVTRRGLSAQLIIWFASAGSVGRGCQSGLIRGAASGRRVEEKSGGEWRRGVEERRVEYSIV